MLLAVEVHQSGSFFNVDLNPILGYSVFHVQKAGIHAYSWQIIYTEEIDFNEGLLSSLLLSKTIKCLGFFVVAQEGHNNMVWEAMALYKVLFWQTVRSGSSGGTSRIKASGKHYFSVHFGIRFCPVKWASKIHIPEIGCVW